MAHLSVSDANRLGALCKEIFGLSTTIRNIEQQLIWNKEQKSKIEQVLADVGYTLLVNHENHLESILVPIDRPLIPKEEEKVSGTVAVYLPKKERDIR